MLSSMLLACKVQKTCKNQGFYQSLRKNGILFIGGTETMLDANEIGFQRLYPCSYSKSATVRDSTRVVGGVLSNT